MNEPNNQPNKYTEHAILYNGIGVLYLLKHVPSVL
jgi:hypothetical protein